MRKAIESGRISLHHAHYAKGPLLEAVGFRQATGELQTYDVIVIQPVPGSGHMAIFDGSVWVSDFKRCPREALAVEQVFGYVGCG